jgi:hypothetical protein
MASNNMLFLPQTWLWFLNSYAVFVSLTNSSITLKTSHFLIRHRVRYGQSLEQTVFAGRTADYLFFILFESALLLVLLRQLYNISNSICIKDNWIFAGIYAIRTMPYHVHHLPLV